MLATLLIWLSVAVAVLALVDLFLSKEQKDWLSSAVVKLWSILDEAKAWSFADWLKNPRAKWWLAITFGLVGSGYALAEDLAVFGSDHILLTLTAIAISTVIYIWIAFPIFATLLRFAPGQSPARRLAIVSCFALISIVIVLPLFGWIDRIPNEIIREIAFTSVLLLGTVCSFALFCVAFILVALALAYTASAILYVGEFLVRRIAEYPKGPVLALSALFGGIAALIKTFVEP